MVKKIILNITLSIGGIVFFFLIAEIITRIIAPQDGLHKSRWLYENNKILGYSMKPFFSFIHKDWYSQYSVNINSKGLRSSEYAYNKSEGVYRIIILGDSFTFGHGVQDNETFSYFLNHYINNGNNNFEVINSGVSGYGPWEELEWLRNEGYKYKPDLVITAFCEDNDFLDNYMAKKAMKYGKLRREVIDGWLVEVEVSDETVNNKVEKKTLNPIWMKMASHSHLRDLIRIRIKRFQVKYNIKSSFKNLPEQFFALNVLKKNYTTLEESMIISTKKILSKTSDYVQSIESDYVIMSIPIPETVNNKLFGITLKQLKLDKDNYDINKPEKILESFCVNNNIPFIKLSEYLNNTMYFPLNRHLNPRGNQTVGRILANYVKLSHP